MSEQDQAARLLAHIREDGAEQTVEEHLKGTAQLAALYGRAFGAEEQARLAGLLHDIGKCSDPFQRRLRGDSHHVDHSTAGAVVARQRKHYDLAFAIAGHHGGLPDGGSTQDTADDPTLSGRCKKTLPDYHHWKDVLGELPPAPPPSWLKGADKFSYSFYIRMLFSCLVDADFQDTEAFMRPDEPPRGDFQPLSVLHRRVREKAASWLNAAPEKEIDALRNRILRACMDCGAGSDPGLFTLTVPTGGGKTFASLAFAMEHAARCGMERVIYIVPYTSIIEQTVDRFREILGEENVLAHYASADHFRKDTEDLSPAEYRYRLAAENWDAPVIVTTAVQFFESLFAARPAKCRKLHNIANSVLIFDEAQTLPMDFLRPCVAAMGQLALHYKSSVVLCTATQPALGELFAEFAPGLPLREICETGLDLYAGLRRTTFAAPGTFSEDALTEKLCEFPQVLCVVNRRKTAQALFDGLSPEGRFCLTTLLTPQDRRRKLKEIRRRLTAGEPCRVVSTSLIEAGVDVDFPAAFREEAGLDSVLQTAGRCNREGLRPAAESVVYVFALEDSAPPRAIRQNLEQFHALLDEYPQNFDTPEAIARYFSSLHYVRGNEALDEKEILPAFNGGWKGSAFPFRQVADIFHLIDSPAKTVYVPIGEGAALCQRLRQGEVSHALLRQLGEYAVAVYPDHFDKLYFAGALERLPDGSGILTDTGLKQYYSVHTGLSLDAEDGQGITI